MISRYIPPRWGRCHGAWCNRRGRRHRQARGSDRASFAYLSPRKVWPRSDVAPASCISPADIETKEDDDRAWWHAGGRQDGSTFALVPMVNDPFSPSLHRGHYLVDLNKIYKFEADRRYFLRDAVERILRNRSLIFNIECSIIMKIVGSGIRADGTIVFIRASLKSNLSYCEFIWGSFIQLILISCLDPYDPIVSFFYLEISFPLILLDY